LIKSAKSNSIELVGIYPNPATSNLNVLIESPDYRKATITIADIFGKKLLRKLLT